MRDIQVVVDLLLVNAASKHIVECHYVSGYVQLVQPNRPSVGSEQPSEVAAVV